MFYVGLKLGFLVTLTLNRFVDTPDETIWTVCHGKWGSMTKPVRPWIRSDLIETSWGQLDIMEIFCLFFCIEGCSLRHSS